MQTIYELAKTKTVIMISHRLANCANADRIYTLENGSSAGFGTHSELLSGGGAYAKMWHTQQALENVGRGEAV